jgi:Na+/melibiose symporter-like transporter
MLQSTFLNKWDEYFKSLLETESNEYEVDTDLTALKEDNKKLVYHLALNFLLIYLVLRTLFSTSTVFISTLGTEENSTIYFFTFSLGYLIGSAICPHIFKLMKDLYRKTFLVVSHGILIWMLGNLFHYTNEADITDDLNDDNYGFIPKNDFLGSYWLL